MRMQMQYLDVDVGSIEEAATLQLDLPSTINMYKQKRMGAHPAFRSAFRFGDKFSSHLDWKRARLSSKD